MDGTGGTCLHQIYLKIKCVPKSYICANMKYAPKSNMSQQSNMPNNQMCPNIKYVQKTNMPHKTKHNKISYVTLS